MEVFAFFFSSRRRHTISLCDWSSDVCSSDLVIEAWTAGSDFVKVFPCGQVGGTKYIKALKGPLPQIPLVPTGGVNLSTAAEFIEAGAAALGIGGELVQPEALKSNKPELIVETARKFLEIVANARAKLAGVAARGSA